MNWQVIDFNTGEGKLFESGDEALKYYNETKKKYFWIGYAETCKVKIKKVGV